MQLPEATVFQESGATAAAAAAAAEVAADGALPFQQLHGTTIISQHNSSTLANANEKWMGWLREVAQRDLNITQLSVKGSRADESQHQVIYMAG